MPIKVVAITGSLRKASVNAGLLRAAAALAPKHDMEFNIVSADLPLFNEDLETGGAAGDVHNIVACHEILPSYRRLLTLVAPPVRGNAFKVGSQKIADLTADPIGRKSMRHVTVQDYSHCHKLRKRCPGFHFRESKLSLGNSKKQI